MLINGRQKLACLAGIEEAVAEEQDADGDEDAGGNADGAPASERGTDADARRADADLVVEPLDAFTHIRDLAVDPTGFFDRFPSGARYLRSSETNRDAPVAPEAAGDGSYAGYERFENCIECGLCISACPVTKAFVGPATLAAFHRELKNAPERREEILGMVDTEDGVWACQRALNCSRVCPTEVYPAKHIAMLQRELKKERG
jgi:succinate dehydrogenase / fumarate reductase iron-sulfur subunit